MKEPRKICGFPSHYIVNPLPAPNLCPSAFLMTDPSLHEPFRLLITSRALFFSGGQGKGASSPPMNRSFFLTISWALR